MMSFCKKSVHSFLGLTIPMNNNNNNNNFLDLNSNNNINILDYHQNLNNSSSSSSSKLCPPVLSSTSGGGGGLGLITATDIDTYKTPPNVLESTTFKSSSSSSSSSSPSSSPPYSPPPPPPPAPPLVFKKDPGGIGFIDDVGGGVNGLMSCTESLGFESCDERRVDDEIDEFCYRTSFSSSLSSSSSSLTATTAARVNNWRKVGERKEIKKFPPPLPSLSHNGQPSFFLRPVRKNGRLEITEVRIDRPEILRASREDGRLRLHLIRDDDDEDDYYDDDDEEEDDEYGNNNIIEEEESQEQQHHPREKPELKDEFQQNIGEEEEEEEEISCEWRFPVTGEGFRRCHELVNHHHHHHSNHHHNLHVWSQHCVTTR